MISTTLSMGRARRVAGTVRRPDSSHAHRFIMETLEAAMRRQPGVPYGARTVLGVCHCGATTQAKAFFGTGYDLEDQRSRPFADLHQD